MGSPLIDWEVPSFYIDQESIESFEDKKNRETTKLMFYKNHNLIFFPLPLPRLICYLLSRRLNFAPSSNPQNVSVLIAAKQDEVVDWLHNQPRDNKECL